MAQLYKVIIYDYLQRTRNYAFLITLAVSLYAAYLFVPPYNADYTTLRIGNFIGVQNSAWIGYLTAVLAAVFVSTIGFYLVNNGLKKDIDTGVGTIVATTTIGNFAYLLAKTVSNFLILLSIVICVFCMAIMLFTFRSIGYPFEILQFIVPYLLITVPTIFFIASLAVVTEVFLYRFKIILDTGYFIFICMLLSLQNDISSKFDVFGFKQVIENMLVMVTQQYHKANLPVSIGFYIGHNHSTSSFIFDGINWTSNLIIHRVMLVFLSIFMVYIASLFFHRFNIKKQFKIKKIKPVADFQIKKITDIQLSKLPSITYSYSIIPFIKTELIMLIRKGPRWLWLINFIGIIALIFVPLTEAHQLVLPVLWFLQVGRWSDLVTKERTNRIHYFTYTSYQPLLRLFPAQIIAGIILALAISSPLLLRYLIQAQFLEMISIIAGSIFIIILAVVLGLASQGKKLFEIIFLFSTYAIVQRLPLADYLGGINHSGFHLLFVVLLILFLGTSAFLMKKLAIREV